MATAQGSGAGFDGAPDSGHHIYFDSHLASLGQYEGGHAFVSRWVQGSLWRAAAKAGPLVAYCVVLPRRKSEDGDPRSLAGAIEFCFLCGVVSSHGQIGKGALYIAATDTLDNDQAAIT